MNRYSYIRVDTATRVRREELLAQAPQWKSIDINNPQFAIMDGETGKPAYWALLNDEAQARQTCAEFHKEDASNDGAIGPLHRKLRQGTKIIVS